MESDFGWYDEEITNITEENTEQQLSLPVWEN
jgi:hypothetical protein